MHPRSHRFGARSAALALALALPVTAGLPAAAMAAPAGDRGLFGAQDPTYDGAYRQGLAITGLVAVDKRVPRAARTWLLGQQCINGSFQAYRADTSVACAPSDPVNFTGPDTNSTAMAAMALSATGEKRQAARALKWLRRAQNLDGGFPYIDGGLSDANSTGLVLAALRTDRSRVATRRAVTSAERYLRTVQLRCAADTPVRGLFSFQRTPLTPNDLATVQAALGLVTSLPATSARLPRSSGPMRCEFGALAKPVSLRDSALDAVGKRLRQSSGLLPDSFGGGSDPSATAQAAIALAAADRAPRQIRKAVHRLQDVAAVYTDVASAPQAGALGTLLLLAGTTGTDSRGFGGVDLVKALRGIRR